MNRGGFAVRQKWLYIWIILLTAVIIFGIPQITRRLVNYQKLYEDVGKLKLFVEEKCK